jgi:formylglycine-generating enzyme required for sulfatase activity
MGIVRAAYLAFFLFVGMSCISLVHAQTAASKSGTVFRDCPDCPEMVVIPSGSVAIGSGLEETTRENVPEAISARDRPLHDVKIVRPFAVGRFEITKAQYARFVREAGHTVEGGCFVWDFVAGRWNQDLEKSWREPGFPQGENEPAVCVSWDDAKAYVEWLGHKTGKRYRLLTEAEWEYAARAGSTTARYWGDSRDQACAHSNSFDRSAARSLATAEARKNPDKFFDCEDGRIFTAPVGSYQPNAFGLYDVIGNAWEWVEDCFHDTYDGAPSDGSAWTTGDCKYRVNRGGGWGNPPGYSRLGRRDKLVPDTHGNTIGLRVARPLE